MEFRKTTLRLDFPADLTSTSWQPFNNVLYMSFLFEDKSIRRVFNFFYILWSKDYFYRNWHFWRFDKLSKYYENVSKIGIKQLSATECPTIEL